MKDTIILHDNVTEVTREMYLASDPAECIFEGLSFQRDGIDQYEIETKGNVPDGQECHRHCMEHPDCVMFQYKKSHRYCYLRRDRTSRTGSMNFLAGYKLCGSLYYEGQNVGGNHLSTVTFAKNLEGAAIATAEGAFKMKRCDDNSEMDCYVLIEYHE